MKDFDLHIHIINEYEIIPKKIVRVMGVLDIVFELFIGVFLLLGIYTKLAYVIAILLILIYSIAIGINLHKSRIHLKCGCGGFLGNHNISLSLIFRNAVLILSLFYLLFVDLGLAFTNNGITSFFALIPALLTAVIIVLLYSDFSFLMNLNKRGKEQ